MDLSPRIHILAHKGMNHKQSSYSLFPSMFVALAFWLGLVSPSLADWIGTARSGNIACFLSSITWDRPKPATAASWS